VLDCDAPDDVALPEALAELLPDAEGDDDPPSALLLPYCEDCCPDCWLPDFTRIWLLTSRIPLQLSARSSARCFIQRSSTVPLNVATPLLTSTVMPLASISSESVRRSLRSSRMRSSERV
jgi:hypothetical protein